MRTYKLSEIYELQMGKTPSRNESSYWQNGQYSWISIGDFPKNGKYIVYTKEKITREAVQETGIKIIPKDTVIMSFKLTIGKVAITKEAIYSNEAIMAFIDRGVIDVMPQYAYYLFSSKDWSKGTNRAVMGTTLNKATLSACEISIHSLSEQAIIVNKLDFLANLIEKRKQQLAKLEELVKSQFIEMFGDPFVTSSLEKKPLRAIATSIYDGANIPKDCYLSSGDIVFYRIQNVWRNEYRLDDLVYISEQTSCKYADSALATDDILITKIGRYYTKDSSLGRVSIYKGETGKAHFSNNIMRVRLKPCLLGDFLNAMLNLDAYQSYIKKVSVGGTDKRALSKTVIGELPIIVPPLEAQKKFVHIMEQTDKSKFRIKQSLEKLEICYKSLLQKYFG